MSRITSNLAALSTPVTSTSWDLASWMAIVPTPRPAPLMRMFWPDRSSPAAKRACTAELHGLRQRGGPVESRSTGFRTNATSGAYPYSENRPHATKSVVGRPSLADSRNRWRVCDGQCFPTAAKEGLPTIDPVSIWLPRSPFDRQSRTNPYEREVGYASLCPAPETRSGKRAEQP